MLACAEQIRAVSCKLALSEKAWQESCIHRLVHPLYGRTLLMA